MAFQVKSFTLIALLILNCENVLASDDLAALPNLFAPLTWETNPGAITSLLPHHELTEGKYPVLTNNRLIEVNAIFVTQKNKKYFGDAMTVVEHRKNHITGIRIYTTDTRKECVPPPDILPKWCGGHYSENLKSVLFNVKNILEKEYGKAKELPVESDYQTEYKQHYYSWEQIGFKIYLDLTFDEEGYWAVTLSALKKDL